MTSNLARAGIVPIATEHLDGAAELLAARHRAQRRVEPGLDPAYEAAPAARAAIESELARDGAMGVVAIRDGSVAGYLVAAPRAASWGPNMWVEGAGHAVDEPELARDLYGAAAANWVEAGLTSHYAMVPATDAALVDAWFRVGFGVQHVHAIREAPSAEETLEVPAGLVLRRSTRADLPVLAELDLELPRHQQRSPVFSGQTLPSLEETLAEFEEDFDDPRFAVFVVEVDGRVVGSAVACDIGVSSEHHGIVRPAHAGFLGFAAVLPEARGRGAGRTLGEAVLAWSRDEGYPTVVTDWRATNLLSSRTWPRLGFRPTFLRLFRSIA